MTSSFTGGHFQNLDKPNELTIELSTNYIKLYLHTKLIMNTLLMKQVSQNIRTLRKLKNLKQEMMAVDLKMSPHAYANIEQGKTDIQLSRLEQIAQVLGVDITDLFSGEKELGVKLSIESSHVIHNNQQTSVDVHQLSINASHPSAPTIEQEKTQWLLEEKEREIVYLKEMIEWLKQKV